MKPTFYWIIAATLFVVPAYAADQPLTGDEIKAAFVGKSFDSSGGILTYKNDGHAQLRRSLYGAFNLNTGRMVTAHGIDGNFDHAARPGIAATLPRLRELRVPCKSRNGGRRDEATAVRGNWGTPKRSAP